MNTKANFNRLLIGESVSMFGNFVTSFALPFTAVSVLNANALSVGVLTAMGWLPMLLFGLIAGVYVDQVKKAPLLILANIVRALLLGLVPLAWLVGALDMGLLVAVAFVSGSFSTLQAVAWPALVPVLVGKERLVESNSKMEIGSSIAQSVAPTLAGFLMQILAAPLVIVLDAVSFLFAAAGAYSIRHTEPEPQAPAIREGIASRIRQGFEFIIRDKRLSALFVIGVTASLYGGFHNAVFLIFATRELSLTSLQMGIMSSIQGIGTILGAIATTRISRRIGVGKTLVLGGTLFVVSAIIKPILPIEPVMLTTGALAIAQFFAGFSNPLWTVSILSFRQSITPSELLGRVNATVRTAVMGVIPLGALLGGLLGDLAGLRPTLVVAAACIIVATTLAIINPLIRNAKM